MESSHVDNGSGIVNLVENTAAEDFQAILRNLDHPTRQILTKKLSLFHDMILLEEKRPISSSMHTRSVYGKKLHDDDNHKTLKLFLRREHRRCGGGNGGANQYTPTLDTIVLDKNGKICFDMAARDANAIKILVQTIQGYLSGVRIIQLDISTFQTSSYDYRPVQMLLEVCCLQMASVEELVITTSFPKPVAESLDRIIMQHNQQTLRRLSLNLTSNLDEPATKTVANWICNQPELELNTAFLTAKAVTIIGDAIAKTTKLHRLRIGPGLVKKLEHALEKAIRVNRSLDWFQTDILTPSSIGLITSLSERSKLVKDYKVLYDDTSRHHKGFGDAVVKMLESQSWIGGLTFLCTKPSGPDSDMNTEMISILKALSDNTSLRSFSLFVGPPKEKSFRDACWEALIQNTALESFRLDLSAGTKEQQWDDNADANCAYSWETDFIYCVMPNLSAKDLTIQGGVMNLPNKTHDDITIWESLTRNKKLKNLTITEIQQDGKAWEPSLVESLPSLSVERLYLPNFDPRVSGWDDLLQSVKSATQLLSMECNHFNHLRRSSERMNPFCQWFGGVGVSDGDGRSNHNNNNFVSSMNLDIEDNERQMLQQLERFMFLNKAGRRLFLKPSTTQSKNKNTTFKRIDNNPTVLCPYIFERINKLHTASNKGNEKDEKAKKADAIFEFLREDLFMIRSYMVTNK